MMYHGIGLMSGSSLDGLDVAYVRLEWLEAEARVGEWAIIAAETLPFSEQWQARLMHLPQQDALTFAKTATYFGHYMAELVKTFIERQALGDAPIDFVASHGHTIFHQPDKRLTVQIGDGGAMAAILGIPVICDFRSQDIALNGEGAPLAPLADTYLFAGYDFYYNIGGIANISTAENGKVKGFDVCPANQLLNFLAAERGLAYDAAGSIARSGMPDAGLLGKLSAFDFYHQPPPKSLGNEWIRAQILPLLVASPLDTADKLATVTAFIAQQTAQAVSGLLSVGAGGGARRMLVTGGGAWNTFLMEQLQAALVQMGITIVLPDAEIIHFKEALLMVLLGVLRLQQQPNSYRSITGARRDTVNGAVYWATKHK